MQRIIIIGASGSGKTTLGNRLGDLLHIPVYDLDNYFWLPNWQNKREEFFIKEIEEISKTQEWIIIGNYFKFSSAAWDKADTIIWLDYQFMRCLCQGLKRALKAILYKIPCCAGNYESFGRLFFSRESILIFIIKNYSKYQKRYNDLYTNKDPKKLYLRLRNPQETEFWLNSLCM